VQQLVVLRADRLTPSGWAQLLTLCRSTDTRLTFVCHRPIIPAALASALTSSPRAHPDDDQDDYGPDDGQVVHVLRDVRAVVADSPRRRGRRPRDRQNVEPTPDRCSWWARPHRTAATRSRSCGAGHSSR
jgi:hypothetical protein